MAGSKKAERRGGRQKGTPDKKTEETEQRAVEVMAALAVSIGTAPANAERTEAPGTAPAGISPMDLLLTAMRNAWNAGYAKRAQVGALEAQATVVEAEIAGLNGPALAPETVEQIKVNVGMLDALQKRINELRGEAAALITLATELATDVAPFIHPKMATVDSKASGNVRIVIRQF